MTVQNPEHHGAHGPRWRAAASELVRRMRTRRVRVNWGHARRALYRLWRRRWLRVSLVATGATFGFVAVAAFLLWWRLNSGPIPLDLATPWLTAAIEENFGGGKKVEIGGTQIERDSLGRASLRIVDIVVRDADGTVVASAPKAEVGLSGASILSGKPRAVSLNLVGAEMAVRIETDGNITVFTGSENSRPIASAVSAVPPAQPHAEVGGPPGAVRKGVADFAAVLAWLDGLGATGLDGHDLTELGLKNGSLIVDDRRNGKRWNFRDINVTLSRPARGGIIFRLASDSKQRPWEISAALRPLEGGVRAVGIEARNVVVNDLLLASRLGEGVVESDIPLSASLRAEFAADGKLQAARGQVIAESGDIQDPDDVTSRIHLERGDVRFTWDSRRQELLVPFQIQFGGNQVTMVARLEPIADSEGAWNLTLDRGDPVIDPIILAPPGQGTTDHFALNRVTVSARIDPARHRIDIAQAELRRNDVREAYNIGVAINGSYNYSGPEPRLVFGIAGTRMPASVMKRLWPVFVSPHVRSWVEEHISGGTVERLLIACNAPVSVLVDPALAIPNEALSVDIETSGTTIQPIGSLPPIRDADLNIQVSGRSARVYLGRGTIEVTAGRRLNIAEGVFDVPDTHPKAAPGYAKFRVDGSVAAAAALLAIEPLRSETGLVLDPATSRGTLTSQVALELSLSRQKTDDKVKYAMTVDLTNFAADKLLLGQKLEAQTLRVSANSNGYEVKGDVRINGMASAIDLRKKQGEAFADFNMRATLDEASRNKLGLNLGTMVTGSIPITVNGRIVDDDSQTRPNELAVEADFTHAKIDNLLPGWTKAAGKPAKAAFTLIKDGKTTRFDDLKIDSQGGSAKGSVVLDAGGDLVSADFPVFALSDGDKVSLKAERGTNGVLNVQMRGEVYDGRSFVKSTFGSGAPDKSKSKPFDLDLDVKIGAIAGYNGEALRGVELKLSRRGGNVRSFSMNARIGRDSPLIGDLRLRSRDNHQVAYIETDDAGALFRFTDLYPRMEGGKMWLAMDPPSQSNTPQIGVLNIRNFVVRDERGLDRVVASSPVAGRNSIEFTELHCDFTRTPGRMTIRDGIMRGPVIGATIEGQIDSLRDEVRLRGTFVPLYALNNMFGQIPIVGLFLGGGSNEGLFGITYEAVGPPNAPRITVNPISAVAPGLLRKLIPPPGAFEGNYVQPSR
jgi:hypothetical protein